MFMSVIIDNNIIININININIIIRRIEILLHVCNDRLTAERRPVKSDLKN